MEVNKSFTPAIALMDAWQGTGHQNALNVWPRFLIMLYYILIQIKHFFRAVEIQCCTKRN